MTTPVNPRTRRSEPGEASVAPDRSWLSDPRLALRGPVRQIGGVIYCQTMDADTVVYANLPGKPAGIRPSIVDNPIQVMNRGGGTWDWLIVRAIIAFTLGASVFALTLHLLRS